LVKKMADVIKISDATALALHSMVYLAGGPEKQATTGEIAEIHEVSRHHLAKVHQRLRKAGLIVSHRGPGGGIGLAKDAAKITLLDIYEAMEGPFTNRPCLLGKAACPLDHCVLAGLLPGLVRQVRDYFAGTTLAQLAAESSRGAYSE
jgi:Rrf2 family protein